MIQRDVLQRKFRIFIILSFFILLLEVGGGVFTNSLALLSDAGHVVIDLFGLVLAYFAMRLSKKRSTDKYSFGYYRAEVLSAIINGFVLIFVTVYIFYQSYIRFITPRAIKGPEMFVISIIGLLANLYVVIKMQSYGRENLNVRGAYLHVLSDTLSSVGVVIAGGLIIVTGNSIFDPILSAMIGLFILSSSFRLIKESTQILMEATPAKLELEKITEDIQKINGVREVHDLHVWSIASDVYALSSHILINAENAPSMNAIIAEINEMLKSRHNITHTVIQSECESCAEGGNIHNH
jgi:cobalt-zinc-cadmium efflux system protein